MLKLSKKSEYAIQALLFLHNQLNQDELTVSAKLISEEAKIPLDLLSKILQKLVRLNLISSEKGARGGYTLSKPLHSLSLATILNHFESEVRLVPCITPPHVDENNSSLMCDLTGHCQLEKGMYRLNNRILSYFQNITLEELFLNKQELNQDLMQDSNQELDQQSNKQPINSLAGSY